MVWNFLFQLFRNCFLIRVLFFCLSHCLWHQTRWVNIVSYMYFLSLPQRRLCVTGRLGRELGGSWGLRWCLIFWAFLFNGCKTVCKTVLRLWLVKNSFEQFLFATDSESVFNPLCFFVYFYFFFGQTVLGSAKLSTYLSPGPKLTLTFLLGKKRSD